MTVVLGVISCYW